MKRTMLPAGLLILVFSLLIFGVFAQTAKPVPDMPYPLPDSELDNWKKISDDLGVMLYTDSFGMNRGTLYVRKEGRWHFISLATPSELGPSVLPLGEK